MKTRNFFKTLLLLVVLVVGFCFIACEKPENPSDEPSWADSVPTTSDVNIQGTWLHVNPEVGDNNYLRVTFYEHYFSVVSDGPSYWGDYTYHPQWPSNGYFVGINNSNYLVHNGKFYMWHTTALDNFAVMPYSPNIPPTFDVFLHGDTLELQCLFTSENCPDLDLPEETHYTFILQN